jgi:hypothetical protein
MTEHVIECSKAYYFGDGFFLWGLIIGAVAVQILRRYLA